MFSTYHVSIVLLREMLGTNPSDPNVMDTHILDRQRKIIMEKSDINNAVNKYLSAKQISKERGELELAALTQRVEEVIGRKLNDKEIQGLTQGSLKELKELKETLEELDEKGITCFFRDPMGSGKICIGSHMILGFLKAGAEAICRRNISEKGERKNGTMLSSISHSQSMINMHLGIFPEMIPASKDIVREEDGSPKYYQRSLRAKTAQGDRVALAKSELLPKDTVFTFQIKLMTGSEITEEHLKEILAYGELKGLGQWRNVGHGSFKVLEFQKIS